MHTTKVMPTTYALLLILFHYLNVAEDGEAINGDLKIPIKHIYTVILMIIIKKKSFIFLFSKDGMA